MNSLTALYQFLDDTLATAMAKPGNESCCSKGCFHCCREPAYATRAQIKYLLEIYPSEQLTTLRVTTQEWLRQFLAHGFDKEKKPNAFKYRFQKLWCPLLTLDGTCSVYDRRPMECRLFLAQGDPKMCADNILRRKQKFMDAPGIVDVVMRRAMMEMKEGEIMEYDHIGVMLAEELLGVTVQTKARLVVIRQGDDVVIMQNENSVDEQAPTS